MSGLTCFASPCSTRHLVNFETFSTPALLKIVLLVDEISFINSRLIFEIVRVQTDLNMPLSILTCTAVIWLSYIFLDSTVISAIMFCYF